MATISTAKGISIVWSRLQPAPTDSFEVEGMLRHRQLWRRFVSGEIRCSTCDVVVSFENLGTLSEDVSTDELEFICRNPECLDRYLNALESTVWNDKDNAS